MLDWQGTGRSERRMMESLNLIFAGHSKLLEFLFEPDRPRLRQAPEILLDQASGYSSGESILIRVALDLWSGSGDVLLWEIIEKLDERTFAGVIAGLGYLREIPPDGPEILWRQSKTAY